MRCPPTFGRLGLGLALATQAACGPGLVVNTDWNPANVAEMQTWRTYGWLEHNDQGLPYEDLDDVRIRDVVAQNLASRGFVLAAPGQPVDFLVAHHLSVEQHFSVHEPSYYGGWYGWYDPMYGPYYDPYYGPAYVDEWQTGVLVVDIVDATTNELAWRGVAESEPLGRTENPTRRVEILREAIGEMLAEFPFRAAPAPVRRVSQR